MGVFGTLIDRFIVRKMGNVWFYSAKPNTYNQIQYLKAFQEIPELNSTLNLLARAHSNGVYRTYNDKGEVVNTNFDNLLKNPNWFQAQKEFIRQTQLFHDIYGNEYLSLFYGVGLTPQNTKALYSLPPQLTKAEYISTTPFFLNPTAKETVKYSFKKSDGDFTPLEFESIIHLNDNRVYIENSTDKDMLLGQSKIETLTPVLNNIRMAYESRGVILKYRGARGIISPKTKDGIGGGIKLTTPEKDALQEAWRSYGMLGDQNQMVISDSDVGYTKVEDSDPFKLGLYKEVEQGHMKILDAYGVPPTMIARDKETTFENQFRGEKSLYANTVIPAANERAYALNQKLFPDGKVKIVPDFSHLEIFQDDIKLRSETTQKMVLSLSKLYQDGAITIEEYKVEIKKLGIGQ